jgi:Skp family chaperone for outer membrane proteins
MKVFITALCSAVVATAASMVFVANAQTTKAPSSVAYISSNRILSESVLGRAEAGRIQAMQQQKTNEVRAKQQELEAARQQAAAAPDAQARIGLQQKEQQLRIDLERATQQAQVDLQALQREVNGNLQRRVRTVLDQLMANQPYQLVINSDSSLVWSAPELDLTTAVVARMNGQ